VLTIEKYNAQGGGMHFPDMNAPGAGSNTQQVYLAPGQNIYKQRDSWMFSPFVTGLRMKKVSDDAQNLLTWQDGTVAVGMRKIGKGAIIEFGAKSDSGGGTAVNWYKPILESLQVALNNASVEVPAKPDARNMDDYFFREYVFTPSAA
jgi:hypothetical protein